MITGILFLIWGIGIVWLALSLQTKIQESADPEWQHARDLYNEAPILFCACMAAALACWPIIFVILVYKSLKGETHGN